MHGNRVWLTGWNYVWGWEINRLARAPVTAAGGMVLGERYLPIRSCEVDRMIAEIRHARPDVILNPLIGPSSHEFLATYAAKADADPYFRACPVLSCNLTETELPAIGPAADIGHDSQFPWGAGTSPMPMIVLIGSVAPGRIAWALVTGAHAQMLKPVADHGACSTFLIARDTFDNACRLSVEIAQLRRTAMDRRIRFEDAAPRVMGRSDSEDDDDRARRR